MNERSYQLPGWAAITFAVLTLPLMVVGMIIEVTMKTKPAVAASLLLPNIVLGVAALLCGLYALGRFKTLLNERFNFHDVDGLIVAIIIGACLLNVVAFTGRTAMVLFRLDAIMAVPFIVGIAAIGVPLSILGVVFAVKLLRLESDLGGLKKPYVVTTIVASVLFATLILGPLAYLIDAAAHVILGMIFLRPATTGTVPEYV